MKKITLLGYLSMALFFVFASCNQEESNIRFESKQNNSTNLSKSVIQDMSCGETTVVSLIAGQHTDVGTVTVSNDENYLYVIYETTGDWYLTETHLYVGAEKDIPLTKPGNPKIGHFPYQGDHGSVQSYTFMIALSDLDDTFVVVAHAVVDSDSNNSETAFGCGDKEFPGKRWGCYFDYTKQECKEIEECIDAKALFYPNLSYCFSSGGFSDWGWTNAVKYGILLLYQSNNTENYRMPLYINDDGDQCSEDDKIQIGYVELYAFQDPNNSNLPSLSVTYVLTDLNYTLSETNFYMDFDRYPTDSEGNFTTSIDYYNYKTDGLDGNTYTLPPIAFDKEKLAAYVHFIPHAKVCKATM